MYVPTRRPTSTLTTLTTKEKVSTINNESKNKGEGIKTHSHCGAISCGTRQNTRLTVASIFRFHT